MRAWKRRACLQWSSLKLDDALWPSVCVRHFVCFVRARVLVRARLHAPKHRSHLIPSLLMCISWARHGCCTWLSQSALSNSKTLLQPQQHEKNTLSLEAWQPTRTMCWGPVSSASCTDCFYALFLVKFKKSCWWTDTEIYKYDSDKLYLRVSLKKTYPFFRLWAHAVWQRSEVTYVLVYYI